MKLHEIKSLNVSMGTIKKIERIRIQLKFSNSKSKTLNKVSFRLKKEKVSDTSFGRLVSIFYNFSWLSWQLQMHKYRATNLQIE